jgi:hypothetical protein
MERTVRNYQGHLQTPIWIYHHPETGGTLTLIGMVHIGDESYYQLISSLVATWTGQGADVHYEKVRRLTPKELAVLDPADQELVDLFGEFMSIGSRLGLSLDLTLQKAALTPQPDWRNTDFDVLTLARRLGRDWLKQMANKMAHLKNEDEAVLASAARIMLRVLPVLSRLEFLRQSGPMRQIILGERNQLALAAVKEELATGRQPHLVLIWGAGQLPGLHAGLVPLGFRRRHIAWVNAHKHQPLWARLASNHSPAA